MSSNEPEFLDVLHQFFDYRMADVYTALPGQVETYDPAAQRASVTPLVQRVTQDADDNRVIKTMPTIPGVPVQFVGGSEGSVTYAPKRGDTGMLVFMTAAISQWLATGNLSDPGTLERFSLSHAVFIPGVRPFAKPLAGAAQPGDGLVVASPTSVKLGARTATSGVVRLSDLSTFMTVLNSVVDSAGACAALHAALVSASWPTASTKVVTE